MKTYLVTIIDWRYKNGRIVSQRIISGLKKAREHCPVKLSWSRNAKAFWGLRKNIECFAIAADPRER